MKRVQPVWPIICNRFAGQAKTTLHSVNCCGQSSHGVLSVHVCVCECVLVRTAIKLLIIICIKIVGHVWQWADVLQFGIECAAKLPEIVYKIR